MATNAQARLTYRDYLNLPESDDRYELIDGELYMAPTPIPEHQLFLISLPRKLKNSQQGIGLVGLLLLHRMLSCLMTL